MAGSPAANRTHVMYLGQLDAVSSADNMVTEVADALGSAFIPRRLIAQVITGVTVASVTTTLNWRPNPGSATDEKLIATFEIPVLAADKQFIVQLNYNPDSGTTIGAASPTGAYGIAGSASRQGVDESELVCGPGGELELDAPDGEASAGAVNFWLEYELLSTSGNDQQGDLTYVYPDVVGSNS